MKVVSSDAMARIDGRAREQFSLPSLVLMENAGIKAWSAARSALCRGGIPGAPQVFVAGRGNNGGDALVMARQAFVDGCRDVSVILAGGRPPTGSDPAADLAMAQVTGYPLRRLPRGGGEMRGACCPARAGCGTASREPASVDRCGPPLADLVGLMNGSPGRRIAIDVPSGVRDGFAAGDPAVRAELTLTMGLPKLCLYLPRARELCGRIVVVRVGFPPALTEDPAIPGQMLDELEWKSLAAPVSAVAHKGTRGHLAVFAGSPGTTGAAWLAATAAARSRAGLVSLFLDPDTYPVLAPRLQSVMARPWNPSSEQGFDASRCSGLLVGPGWGCAEQRQRWLARLIGTGLPGVIDADGLTLLGRLVRQATQQGPGGSPVGLAGRWVLTPHPGEFAQLTGCTVEEALSDPVSRAVAAARDLESVVVLKGACTTVAAPSGRYWILDGCNPALATGGSGDVLAGIVAGALASGMSPLDAALFGVSLHSRIGRIARRRMGWFLAEDLLPLVSRLLGEAGR